jgi:hypothetical protein
MATDDVSGVMRCSTVQLVRYAICDMHMEDVMLQCTQAMGRELIGVLGNIHCA